MLLRLSDGLDDGDGILQLCSKGVTSSTSTSLLRVCVRITAPPYPAAISSITRSVARASPRALWSPPGSFWLR